MTSGSDREGGAGCEVIIIMDRPNTIGSLTNRVSEKNGEMRGTATVRSGSRSRILRSTYLMSGWSQRRSKRGGDLHLRYRPLAIML